MKKTIRLNESQLNRLVNEAVKRILKESMGNGEEMFQVNISHYGTDEERAFVTIYKPEQKGVINGTKWGVYTDTRDKCVQWADNYNEKNNYRTLSNLF